MPKKADAGDKPERITASHIRAGLKKYFPHPEFGIVFEVAQATGFNAHRHLDAMAMDTWPSRGLTLYGIEIKVDLYDWRREKANPAKAEQLARFCDRFYIAAPAGLIPIAELPEAWGLLEYNAKTGMTRVREAAKTEAVAPTKQFLAAVFRASGRPIDKESIDYLVRAREAELEKSFNDRVNSEAERRSKNNSSDGENWRALITALGTDNDHRNFRHVFGHDARQWIAVIKAVHAAGVMEHWNGLSALQVSLQSMAEKVGKAVADMHLPVALDHADALARFLPKPAKGKKS